MYEPKNSSDINYSVEYVTKALSLMQPGEILASQLPIMILERKEIKADGLNGAFAKVPLLD